MSSTLALPLQPHRARRAPLFYATAALPLAGAILGPALPLLIVFAGTLPAAAPQGSKALAASIALVLVLAVLISAVALVIQRFSGFPRSLVAPFIAVIVTEALAAATGIDPLGGLFSIGCQLGGILMVAAGIIVLSDDRIRHAFLACYFVSAAAAALFAIALSVMRQPPAMFAYEHGRASGTFLQPNEFAGYLLFVIPLALAQSAAPSWLRVLGWTTAAIGAGGLLFSVSRAAILSLVCGLWFYVRRFGRRALLAYFAFAVVALLISVVAFRDVAHDPSENASRISIWLGALRIAQRFALTGVGPLSFHLVYPAFKLPQAVNNEVHAHDLPLQVLIENGVLGLAAAIWFVWAAIKAGIAAARKIPSQDRERILLCSAIVAGFVASALQNAIDVVTTFLLIAGWQALALMLALGKANRPA